MVKDPATGQITEVRCTYDPATRGGDAPDGRKVKGTIHWVSAQHAVAAEVRLYDHLFTKANPSDDKDGLDWKAHLNPASLERVTDAKVEPGLAGAKPGTRYQFERVGYFTVDPDSRAGGLVFNRTVGLRDTWAKIEKSGRRAVTPHPALSPLRGRGLSERVRTRSRADRSGAPSARP